jgi:hypothetical protein
VFTIRDAKITKLQYFANRDGAVEAAGLNDQSERR